MSWTHLSGEELSTEADLQGAFGAPIGRSGRRKSGFWTLRFQAGALTVDASFVADDELALVHIEGIEPTPFGEVAQLAIEEPSETTSVLHVGAVRLSLERHTDTCALSWQP